MENFEIKKMIIPPQGKRKVSIIFNPIFLDNETDEEIIDRDKAILNHILNSK